MGRIVIPIILIVIAGTLFFVFTNPLYGGINDLKTQIAAYNAALDNSKALENERDKVVAKKNAMSTDDLGKLEKLLPDNVNNIRLILEIEQMAVPFGMTLKDIKYNATETKDTPTNGAVVQGGKSANLTPKDYGIFDLEFSTSGTYDNFIAFTKELESNLRIVDISAVSFSANNLATSGSVGGVKPKTNSPEVYKYDFKIKTYWLKN